MEAVFSAFDVLNAADFNQNIFFIFFDMDLLLCFKSIKMKAAFV